MDDQSSAPAAAPSGVSLLDLISLLNRYGIDMRTLLLLFPAGGVWYVDPAMAKTAMFSMLFMAVFALMSHVLRKVFFPYVDTQKFSDAALANPIGAGLVFLGICIVLSGVVLGSVLWMGH